MSFLQKKSGIKRSLILAGGGARLSYHAGVLAALEEEGLEFNHVDGTSGGIFGTAMLASGISPREAAQRWRKVKLSGFMSLLPFKNYLSDRAFSGIGDADGIIKGIFPTLGIDVKKINSNSVFDATFNVCNFSKKTFETLLHDKVTLDHLIAGMSLPVFMPGVKIGKDWYTDGVWIKDANLTGAVNRGAEEIWLVWCIGNTQEYKNGFFNEYVHMIEMSANSSLFDELEEIKKRNKEREKTGLKPIQVHIIKPEYPLPLDPQLFLGLISVETLINMGYADTKKYLANKKAFTFSDIPASSSMKEAESALHFCQQFSGAVSIGQSKITSLDLGFFIREYENEKQQQIFASVVANGYAISCFNAKSINSSSNSLEIEFSFLMNYEEYIVRCQITKISSVDFFLGLGPKRANISISKNGEEKNSSQPFYQTGNNRIRNSFLSSISAKGNIFKRLQKKKELLKQIYTD